MKNLSTLIWRPFEGFFKAIEQAAAKVSDLEITDVSQKNEMALARATRLELKKIRVRALHKKKQLKDEVIKVIDETYNLIADATKPIESDLLEKEKFAERKEEERKNALRLKRIEILAPYGTYRTLYDLVYMTTPLRSMSESAFQQLVEASRIVHENRLEEERIARDKSACSAAEAPSRPL